MVKLLIVEDDVLLDEAYQDKFSEKYEVRIVRDGESGVKAAKVWKPDLILLDIYLPGKLDGVDVLREIKNTSETKNIPVLVITNLPDMIKKVTAMGAERCFMKTDVDLKLIEETLDDLMSKSLR